MEPYLGSPEFKAYLLASIVVLVVGLVFALIFL